MGTTKDFAALNRLIELVHHRWNIPVVAELHRRSGAKFITLANALDVGRGSLSTSLRDLIDQGWVMRNPGYGHPLRPEYLLTPAGKSIGEQCSALLRLVGDADQSDLAFRKWTLPLIAAIGSDMRRFNELRSVLGDEVTPRAVTLGLKTLLSGGWAERSLINDYPPAAGYSLTPRGRRVLDCLPKLD